MWSGTDLKIGGRTATCEFEGHRYELGASVIHSRNKYLSDAVKDYGKGSRVHIKIWMFFYEPVASYVRS